MITVWEHWRVCVAFSFHKLIVTSCPALQTTWKLTRMSSSSLPAVAAKEIRSASKLKRWIVERSFSVPKLVVYELFWSHFSGVPSLCGPGVSLDGQYRSRFLRSGKLTAILHIYRHRGRQLCHLPESHHGPVHWMPSESGVRNQWRVYRGLGCL